MSDELATLFEKLADRESTQRFLRRLRLDSQQFVLFLGLFRTLSEREKLSGPIGANRFNLAYLALYAGAIGALPWSLMACSSIPAPVYLLLDLGIVFIFAFLIMLRESANVFFNPAGFSIFAHTPIHTPTYAAAQMAHILITVFYLTCGLALYPAFIGIMLNGARWHWFFTHITAAVLIGLWTTLLICAFYGVMSRWLPSHLLKSISQWIQIAVMIAMIAMPVCFPEILGRLFIYRSGQTAWNWLPLVWFAEIGMQGCKGAAWLVGKQGLITLAATLPIFWLGLRNLSGNYLYKRSSMAQTTRRFHLNNSAAIRNRFIRLITGSPTGLAAYCFTGKMMRRDCQYRRAVLRQSALLSIFILAIIIAVFRDAHPASPFSGSQSFMHLLPHIIGLMIMILCTNICYSEFYKGSWIYQVSPMIDMKAFAKGAVWAIWAPTSGASHLILLPFLIHFWGWKEGCFITGFSLAVVSLYLVFIICMISGLPFANPFDEFKTVLSMTQYQVCGLMTLFLSSSLQWAIFQIRWAAISTGIVLIILVILASRWALGEFESAILWNLHTIRGQTTSSISIYRL